VVRLAHAASLGLLLIATLVAVPARSQVIEFEAPEQIVVDESRLIVTFADTVDLDRARAIVEGAGGTVADTLFRPVLVWALFETPPAVDPLLALRSDRRVTRVSVLPPSASTNVWVTTSKGIRLLGDFSTHALKVELPPQTDAADATAIVHAYFPEELVRVERYPNELVVHLPDDGDAVATAIEATPGVSYVTYFSLDEPVPVE
ncbi:MAG TPA: hypothetical protein VF190_04675, partial [Rhodothermales bacterium]